MIARAGLIDDLSARRAVLENLGDREVVRNCVDRRVGDATTFPVKQGGLACQQADAVAELIAAAAGAEVEPTPFRPVLRGKLMTGGRDRFLHYGLAGGQGAGQVSEQPLWWPPTKIAGRYLSPYLLDRDETDLRVAAGSVPHVAVELPLDRMRTRPGRTTDT